ncbi:MAG: hypothetical protein ACM3UZ_04050 [Acidobacteriota bacterium]
MNDTREYTLTALFFVCLALITGVIVIVAINAPLRVWLVEMKVPSGFVELAAIGVMALWAAGVIMATGAFYRHCVTIEGEKKAAIMVFILLVLAGCLLWYLISTDSYIIKPLLHHKTTG